MTIRMDYGQEKDPKVEYQKKIEKVVLAIKNGDWNAEKVLVHEFTPIIKNIAEKRSSDVAEVNRLMELGQEGLLFGARNYTKNIGADKIKLYVLDYIEQAMDGKTLKKPGFFARLLGK